jgi:hypothetical protein
MTRQPTVTKLARLRKAGCAVDARGGDMTHRPKKRSSTLTRGACYEQHDTRGKGGGDQFSALLERLVNHMVVRRTRSRAGDRSGIPPTQCLMWRGPADAAISWRVVIEARNGSTGGWVINYLA